MNIPPDIKEINDKIMSYALTNKGYGNLSMELQMKIFRWYELMTAGEMTAATKELGNSILSEL